MNIESLTNRFIPEDIKKHAETKINSAISFLQDAGYKDIMISLGVEHPDKRTEGEQLSFVFSTKMTIRRFDVLVNHIIRHGINQYGEKS